MIYKTYWFNKILNVGDLITPYLLNNLFNVKYDWVDPNSRGTKYMSTGSIIGKADSNTIVWGSGSISSNLNLKRKNPKILAVRGPLTRNLIIKNNIQCPEVYGDPGLLLPLAYNPVTHKKYRIGVIPHYVDAKTPFIESCNRDRSIKVINVQERNVEHFINQVLECELILSSSLHGLIIADAYQIPSVWIELSKGVIGNGFKFNDYYASIKRDVRGPRRPTLDNLNSIISNIKVDFDIDLDRLIKTSPFK